MQQDARPCDPRYIRSLLSRHGFHSSRRLGQHFLTDSRVPETIVERAGITRSHFVLEIGPGLGALTLALSAAAGRVAAVEVDKSLLPLLNETLSGLDNVTLIHADILKMDLRALVREHLGREPESGGRLIIAPTKNNAPLSTVHFPLSTISVCANLPYNITTPVIRQLLSTDLFGEITVMVQKEVAQRLCAAAGTPAYGAFTVFVGARAVCTPLFDVPPGCFTPPPKVTSSVVKLTRRIYPLYDPALFERVTRAAFAQRRKTLVNALAGVLPLSKAELTEALLACGLTPLARGETLDVEAFDRLTQVLSGIRQQ